jgi:hypothetical protein
VNSFELEGFHEVVDEKETYHVTARPPYGREFTVYVRPHVGPRGGRGFKTCRTPDSDGAYSYHPNFVRAVKSANYRARRYLNMHRKPFGIQKKEGQKP